MKFIIDKYHIETLIIQRSYQDGEMAARTNRDIQREQTHERIYNASIAEFRRTGVAKAQIAEIARAAGVAYGSFYAHFAGKDEVLRECSRRAAGKLAEQLDDIAPESYSTSHDFFDRLAQMHVDAKLDAPELRHEIWAANLRRPVGDEPPEHFMRVAEHIGRLQELGVLSAKRSSLDLSGAFLTALVGLLAGTGAPPSVLDTLVGVFGDATSSA